MKKSILLLFVAVLLCGCSQTKGKTETNTKQEDTVKVTAKIPHFGICIGDDFDKSVAKLEKAFGQKAEVSEDKTEATYKKIAYNGNNYSEIRIFNNYGVSKVSDIVYTCEFDGRSVYIDALESVTKKYKLPQSNDIMNEHTIYSAYTFCNDGTKVNVYGNGDVIDTRIVVSIMSVKPMNLE